MSTTASPILERLEPRGGHPAVTYRQAGDRAVLVEYGEMELDLTLNFFVLAVDSAVSAEKSDGLIETAPGFRSMLVRYDPLKLSTTGLLTHLSQVHE
ncbi:MAG: carboxyltransferase domain-containing protein, partial [Solirubrobacterales bacterium]|nr:carboxyltransferase domain-containing protein [Solirubrobacterales bacterium]